MSSFVCVYRHIVDSHANINSLSIRLNATANQHVREDADGAIQSITSVLQAAVNRQYLKEQPLRVKFSGEEWWERYVYLTFSSRLKCDYDEAVQCEL